MVEERSAGQTVGWSALIPPYRFTLTATAPLETEVIALSARSPEHLLCRTSGDRLRGLAEPVLRDRPAPAAFPGHVAARDAAHGGDRAVLRDRCSRIDRSVAGAVWAELLGRRMRPNRHPPPTAPEQRGSAAPAVFRRHFPLLQLPRRHDAQPHPARTDGHAHRHRAEARRNPPLVPGLPRRQQPRLPAPGQRRARAVRRILPPVRPVPRRKIPRLASRRARPPHRQLERRQELPAVRPLPQSAPAAVPRAGAQARARGRPAGPLK